MDTSKLRQLADESGPLRYSAQTTLHLALAEIADALDEMDERLNGIHRSVTILDKRTQPEVTTPEPAHDTCDCGICSEGRQGVSTIPGCYCRECKYYREDDEIEGLGWCECPHPVANTTGFASREYGCVFGERREAE